MKRIITLALSLSIGIFGCIISHNPVESQAQAAVLSKRATSTEYTTVKTEEPTALILPPETEETACVETTQPVTQKAIDEKSGFLWPADTEAEIMAKYPAYSDGSAHWGVDIGLYDDGSNISEGTAIYAASDGIVVTVFNDGKWNTGFGNYCVIDHGNGIQTLYAHSKDIHVSEGDTVEQGQIIGIIGDTGNTTAPHLHFEVRVETERGSYKRVNPLKFISEP